jgi:YgiT-type zinc finger domain-containing protein
MKELKTCVLCKGKVERTSVRVIRQRGSQIIVFDDVPAECCTQCGERYYEGWVSIELHRLMESAGTTKKRMSVPVIPFTRSVAEPSQRRKQSIRTKAPVKRRRTMRTKAELAAG